MRNRLKTSLLMALFLTFSKISLSQFPSPYVVPNLDWIKKYSQADAVNNIPTALDANSNVYITGYVGLSGSSTLIAMKYDSTGTAGYTYTFGSSGQNAGNAIKVDASGNAFVAGVMDDPSTGHDYFFAKIAPGGTQTWQNQFDGGFGGLTDEATDLTILPNGNLLITGRSQNNNDFDIVTILVNGSNGNVMWQHTFAGNSNMDDSGTGIVAASNGAVAFVTGNTDDSSTGTDIVVYALNVSTGSQFWSPVIINGTANGNDKSKAIILCGANIAVCGETDNTGSGVDATVIKLDGTNGSIIFQDDYDTYSGSNNWATALARDSTGNIAVTGIALNGSIYEYHTNLYDSTGSKYASNIEGTGMNTVPVEPRICNDTIAHHWYISGQAARVSDDIFVYQVTPWGNTSWRQYAEGQSSGVDCATGVAVNGVGVVYAGGYSENSTTNFDLTVVKINQTPLYWPPDFNGETVNLNHLYLKNKGQIMRTDSTFAGEVQYYTENRSPSVYIEHDGFNFVFCKSDTVQSTLDTLERIRYKFVNNNPLANMHEYLPRSTSYNYYLGYASAQVVEDVRGNERIFIPNYYPYIDLHYFSGATGVKYYLVVKPGALLDELTMEIEGATATSIDGTSGELEIDGVYGDVAFSRPVAYTVNMLGQVVAISGSASWYNVTGNIYQIVPPGTYNPALPLIIQVAQAPQPSAGSSNITGTNLDYSTYKGGADNDVFNDVSVRSNGDRAICGYATGQYFPVQNGPIPYSGKQDAVLLHYTADDTLRVATYMGGAENDLATSVAYDSQGNIFIGGNTYSTDMLGLNVAGATNQFQNGGASGSFKQDGFLAKFLAPASPNYTSALIWRRYFGGSHSDGVNSIFIDWSDNLYVAGWTHSTDFPVVNAFKATGCATTAANPGNRDAIFGKFNSGLSAESITYYGGSANGANGTVTYDEGTDIVVDKNYKVICVGFTDANNLSTVNNTGQPNTFYKSSISGTEDGFIVRYMLNGTPDFSSYFGGNGSDAIKRVVYKLWTDEIYFAGTSSNATGFPFVNRAGAFNSTYSAGGRNPYVAWMDGDLNKEWCTFWGNGAAGTKWYNVNGLSVDEDGIVYLSGWTDSDTLTYPSSYPVTVVYKDSVRSFDDGFIAVFNQSKNLYHTHYFGGSSNDRINNSDIGQNQKLYVVGYTTSDNFPISYTTTTASLIDSTFNGGQDGFISRFVLQNYQVTGVDKATISNSEVLIYPNPASSTIQIERKGALRSGLKLEVYNLMGQKILEGEIKGQSGSIDCESWPKGVYLITLSNNEERTSFKVIKN